MKFNIWDTAGLENYRCLTQMYIRDVNIALIVFDLTDPRTLENVEFWANEVKLYNMEEFFIILVGNKKDLVD